MPIVLPELAVKRYTEFVENFNSHHKKLRDVVANLIDVTSDSVIKSNYREFDKILKLIDSDPTIKKEYNRFMMIAKLAHKDKPE